MTSPVAVVGLTYDGTDLQDSDLQLFLTITAGLWEHPSVRGTDQVVPSLAGRLEGNRVNDVLPIELDGLIRAPMTGTLEEAHATYVAKKAAVRTLFASNRERAPLVATLEDGSTATISARPMTSAWPEKVPGLYSELHLQLEAYGDWVLEVGS
jgi:hypothetical protein